MCQKTKRNPIRIWQKTDGKTATESTFVFSWKSYTINIFIGFLVLTLNCVCECVNMFRLNTLASVIAIKTNIFAHSWTYNLCKRFSIFPSFIDENEFTSVNEKKKLNLADVQHKWISLNENVWFSNDKYTPQKYDFHIHKCW